MLLYVLLFTARSPLQHGQGSFDDGPCTSAVLSEHEEPDEPEEPEDDDKPSFTGNERESHKLSKLTNTCNNFLKQQTIKLSLVWITIVNVFYKLNLF